MREEFAHILEEVLKGRGAQYERELDGRRIVRRFEPKERLILLGGGHIARPLCRLGSMLDFEVTVVDDRPSFANSSRFPDAAKILCSSFEKAVRDLALKSGDYVCVITRGHRYDNTLGIRIYFRYYRQYSVYCNNDTYVIGNPKNNGRGLHIPIVVVLVFRCLLRRKYDNHRCGSECYCI